MREGDKLEDERLRAARIATLFAIAKPTYLGGTLVAAMLVAVLWDVEAPAHLLAWFGAFCALMAARGVLHWSYERATDRSPDAARWERRYALGCLGAGLLWAYVPVMLMPRSSELLQAAVVIIVGGALMAGAGLSAASPRAVTCLAVMPLATLAGTLALQPGRAHWLLAASILLFGYVMSRMSRGIYLSIVEALREHLRNDELLERAEASETRLRDAIQSCHEAMAVWDKDDKLVVCNESYAAVYGAGRSAAQLEGTPFERIAVTAWESEHPAGQGDDASRAVWIERHVQRHREGSGESLQYQGRDGRWRQGSTVRMQGGGWVGLVSDITELKRAQDSFFRVLAEEDLVLDTLPVGVAFIENRKVVRCNRRLEQMLGYAAGELQGKSTRDWFSSEARWTEAREESYRRMQGGGIMEGDARLVRKDGSRTWCRVLGRMLDPEAEQQSAILTFADINERIAAERALRESEEKLRLAVDAAGLVYWEWDRESGKVSWARGPGAHDLQVLDSAHYRDLVHPEDRDRYVAAVDAAWEQGEPYSAEYRVLSRDGVHVWVSARGKTVPERSGRARRMIGVSHDVTARKAQEDMVRFLAHHDPLTGLPNRRLLDDRLRQALFQAERRGSKVAAMLIDLDQFKRVNDSAGHRAGDSVLREVGARLGSCVRKADTLARHGGDEFVIVLADVQTPTDCQIVAEKILQALEPAFHAEGADYTLGASIGISISPGDAPDADALLRNADAAMYQAKQLGRNRFQFYGR